jgi:hypothetical protein
MTKPILCVDFDGVIHAYISPWQGPVSIPDGPVPGALAWLWEASKVFEVVIYSSRSKFAPARQRMRDWLMAWADKELGQDHPLAAEGDDYPIKFDAEKPPAFLTIDDRALTFEGDWEALDPQTLLAFKPWNKRPQGTIRPDPGPKHGWTCFHCGETFTTHRAAETHFGKDEGAKEACRIIAGAEITITERLRDVEAECARAWGIVHSESSDAALAYQRQNSRHAQQLRAMEELGYQRGLRDGLSTPPVMVPVASEATSVAVVAE